MNLTINQWHMRYKQQARWTQKLRQYAYSRVGIEYARRILDVGCGTGVLLEELTNKSDGELHGLDINPNAIYMAHEILPKSIATLGDAHQLPYQTRIFDVSLCHFLLLWVSNPLIVLEEMARVTKVNGFILALAEPDYGGRIDYPDELSMIGKWQTEALIKQGANPLLGRELRALFSRIGLQNIEAGVLGGQWVETQLGEEFELEWQVIRSDLDHYLEVNSKVEELKSVDLTSRIAQQRILFVPTFYAIGQVKE